MRYSIGTLYKTSMNNKGVDHYLIHYEEPSKEVRTVTDCIVFVNGIADTGHAASNAAHFKLCTITPLGDDDEIIILDVKVMYTHSDYTTSYTLETLPMWKASKGEHHPDLKGGVFSIPIPGDAFRGPIPPDSRLLYQPRFKQTRGDGVPILQYVGFEDRITGGHSTVVTSSTGNHGTHQPFNQTDPLLVFLLQNKHRFNTTRPSDIHKHEPTGTYLVHNSLVTNIKSFFVEQIFPLIHYTKIPHLTLQWKDGIGPTDPGIIMCMVTLDYMVIRRGRAVVPEFKAVGIKITI